MKRAPLPVLLLFATFAVDAAAQSASLLRAVPAPAPPGVAVAPPISAEQVSLIKLAEPPSYRLHDLVHIKVNEAIVNRVNARINGRRDIKYQYSLEDWIVMLNEGTLRPDDDIRAQTPGIDFQSLTTNQKQFQFNRDDMLRYSLQAEVVEVRPNGNLVIEANKEVSVNNEVYQYRLSGVISPLDIDPLLRMIDSTHVASPRIDLRQLGQARDGLKRGWFSTFLDWFNPF